MHNHIFSIAYSCITGAVGWFIGVYAPTFPLLAVAMLFILWDVQTAWSLDKRVHILYPDKVKRKRAKFQSFKVGKIVITIIRSSELILLMFTLHRWVFASFWDLPLEYVATAIICGWQLLSVLENNASCPMPGTNDSKFWSVLRHVLVDKTSRHFDIDLTQLEKHEETDNGDNSSH